jgi:hypothetical protein
VNQGSTLTPSLSFGAVPFQGANDTSPFPRYDEVVTAPCTTSTAGCLANLQTGTVAGTISLNATFEDSQGNNVNYSGSNAQLQVTVPQAAPVLTSVAKPGTPTTSSFQINVTGYSTPRKDTQVCFKFTPASGAQLDTSALNSCYAGDIAKYYQLTTSYPAGSMFTVTETFSYSGDPNAIGTVDTWLANDQGTSNHVCLNFKAGTTTAGACQ